MFINLTPHEINEMVTNRKIPSSGRKARVEGASVQVATIDGVPIYRSTFENTLEGLPEPVDGVTYIVSALTLNAVPKHRTDVVAPGNTMRDKRGKAIGCQGFRCA